MPARIHQFRAGHQDVAQGSAKPVLPFRDCVIAVAAGPEGLPISKEISRLTPGGTKTQNHRSQTLNKVAVPLFSVLRNRSFDTILGSGRRT